MRGRPGEAVNLTVLRESEKKIVEFKIVRDIIKIKDIRDARILEDGIGYIRLVEFRENTPTDIGLAIDKLSRLSMSALILDLRNNPGGLLESAAKTTAKFLPKDKLVVYTKGRKDYQNLKLYAQEQRPLVELPLAVLINEGSASGSEILAGALQDYKRAIILGTKSFGKGSVQTVIPLSDGSALRLTTSKYFTPLGKEIHGKGVIPDIIVEDKNKADKNQEILEDAGIKDKPLKDANLFIYKDDPQVMRALDMLKAIKLYKGEKIK
jgi:carboxyl-terminal processing protease